jgi:hypothetical protein
MAKSIIGRFCGSARHVSLICINARKDPAAQFPAGTRWPMGWANTPGGIRMDTDKSEIIVGLMMAIFGLAGLFLTAGAMDDEMYIFGISLTGFSICFICGLVKQHYDRVDRDRVKARELSHV